MADSVPVYDTESDITAANGVIHLIEGVMIPTDVKMIGSTEN